MSVEDDLRAVVASALKELELGLVKLSLHGGETKTLQILIEKLGDGSVNIDDCAGASRHLSTVLDVEDIIEGRYYLEVSSPGVERPLDRLEDYKRFAGKKAVIMCSEAIDGQKKFEVILNDVDDDKVITLYEDERLEFDFDMIKSAKLSVELDFSKARKKQSKSKKKRNNKKKAC
jgi:ribosome maturation factor RimP